MRPQMPAAVRRCCATCGGSPLTHPVTLRPQAAAAADAWPGSGCAAPHPPSASACRRPPGAGHSGKLGRAGCRVVAHAACTHAACTHAACIHIKNGHDHSKPAHTAALANWAASRANVRQCLVRAPLENKGLESIFLCQTPRVWHQVFKSLGHAPIHVLHAASPAAWESCLRRNCSAPCGRALAPLRLDHPSGSGPLLWRQARAGGPPPRTQLSKPWRAYGRACTRAVLPMHACRGACEAWRSARSEAAAAGLLRRACRRRRTGLPELHVIIRAQSTAARFVRTLGQHACLNRVEHAILHVSSLRAETPACRGVRGWYHHCLKGIAARKCKPITCCKENDGKG